jgi:hypothetical protein
MKTEIKETRGRRKKYDFSKMRIGDSQAIKGNVQSIVSRYAKKSGKSFRTWKEGNKVIIIRVR